MYTKQILASGAFIAAVAAVPMNKRDMVMVTETDMAYVTVPVTTTVWVDASESTLSTKQKHYGHKSHKTTTVLSTIVVQPTAGASSSTAPSSYEAPSSSSRSVYVAPTTESSSSVYVAPTTSSVYVAPTTSTTSVYVAPTTSSVYVAPTTSTTSVYVAPTTTSVYVAPTTSTTSVYVAPTTSSAAPSAYSSAASSSSSGESSGPGAAGTSYKGDLTWYQTGLGSCGWTSGSSDKIVALSHVIMDAYDTGNSNTNPMCGKMVTITGKDGSPYQAKVVDRCVGCAEGDLDLSEDFFNTVTENGDGRVPGMSWSFN